MSILLAPGQQGLSAGLVQDIVCERELADRSAKHPHTATDRGGRGLTGVLTQTSGASENWAQIPLSPHTHRPASRLVLRMK